MHPKEVVKLSDDLKRTLANLRLKVSGAVLFVDLVGSTEYKDRNPREEVWLARLATFLLGVTKIVESNGRVVKYIGDEVMAFFEGPNATMFAAQAAEQVMEFCRKSKSPAFEAKIAMDFGEVSMLHFAKGRRGALKSVINQGDPNGIVVDRCARIMSKSVAGVVLASESFRDASTDRKRWRRCGRFQAKGIERPVSVFQLSLDGVPTVTIRDERMNLPDCIKQVAKLEAQLGELRALRRPIPRRPRGA